MLFPLCRDVDSFDNQQHLLKCTSLMNSNIILLEGPVYDDLFFNYVKKQSAVASVLLAKFTKKKELLKKKTYHIESGPSEPVTPCNSSLLY